MGKDTFLLSSFYLLISFSSCVYLLKLKLPIFAYTIVLSRDTKLVLRIDDSKEPRAFGKDGIFISFWMVCKRDCCFDWIIKPRVDPICVTKVVPCSASIEISGFKSAGGGGMMASRAFSDFARCRYLSFEGSQMWLVFFTFAVCLCKSEEPCVCR